MENLNLDAQMTVLADGYFNHPAEYIHRRGVVTVLREQFGIVARFSDSTTYLEEVLLMAFEEQDAREIEAAKLLQQHDQLDEMAELILEAEVEIVDDIGVPGWRENKEEMRAAMSAMMDELELK